MTEQQTELTHNTDCELTECAVETPQVVAKPRVEILESEEHFTVLAEMPGVDEQDAEVTFEQNRLTIRGTASLWEKERYTLGLSEFNQTAYERTFTVTEDVEVEEITASMKDGLLTVVLKKAVQPGPAKIEITPG